VHAGLFANAHELSRFHRDRLPGRGIASIDFLPTLGGNPTSNRFETETCLPDEALTKVGHTCGRWAAF
jgi:hypothetical protein